MQPMVFALAVLHFTATVVTKNYVSPPLDWLNGARVHWDLRHSAYSIRTEGGNMPYRKRYMEFDLTLDTKGAKTHPAMRGSMNFWSTNRLLIGMHLINPNQARNLGHLKRIRLNESGFVSEVVNCPARPSYNLYIEVDRSAIPNKSAQAELERLFSHISLSK